MSSQSEKLNDILILRVESLISSLSKFVLIGTTVLLIGFSILSSAGKTFTIFSISISTTFAPMILSFIALCIVYQQRRIVKTIDKLIKDSPYKQNLLLVANSHHALINPYYQTGSESNFFTNTFGVILLTSSNIIMFIILGHLAFSPLPENKVYLTFQTLPVYLCILITGINIVIFLGRTLKRSMDEICSDTAYLKYCLIIFLVICIFTFNRQFFQ